MEPEQSLSELQQKLDKFIEAQNKLKEEVRLQENKITYLSSQINSIIAEQQKKNTEASVPASRIAVNPEKKIPITKETMYGVKTGGKDSTGETFIHEPVNKTHSPKVQIESFIGENLANKIGILVIIIGVAIGAKYSIENNLITPITRILIGYITGIGLLATSLRIRKRYHNFSAVLLSGAMAVFYFDTFVAYGFYELIPRLPAFALMLVFTAFTVAAAINYNRQVIAHIGLVGAYAIPFLLNDNSGRADLLFTYTLIINAGVLFIAFKRYWKPLYYSSFIVTWLVFTSWALIEYDYKAFFTTAILFAAVFFAGFYTMLLTYKLLRKEAFQPDDVFLFLINAFVFYGIGYFILNTNPLTKDLTGLFTIINSVIHAIACYLIQKARLTDKRFFQIALSLVVAFVVMAVPVQLDGNWVTLFWTLFAAALFWFAVKSNQKIFELYAYSIILIAAISMCHDWVTFAQFPYHNSDYMNAAPFFNPNVLTALIFNSSLGFIFWKQKSLNQEPLIFSEQDLRKVMRLVIPSMLLTSTWFMMCYEISMIFDQMHAASAVQTFNPNYKEYYTIINFSIIRLKDTVLVCFSLFYLVLLSFGNRKYVENKTTSVVLRYLNPLAIWVFLFFGLMLVESLQNNYIHPMPYSHVDSLSFVFIRYIMVIAAAALVIYQFKFVRPSLVKKSKIQRFDLFIMFAGIFYLHTELSFILRFVASSFFDKGVTILWAAYAAVFIWLGIKKNLKHIRIGAFVIFGFTLLKLLIFDISQATTITKIILFILVGVLLLISSFLYNKFSSRMFER